MKTCKKLMAVILTIATLIGIFSCATSVFAEEYNEYTDNKAYQESLLTEAVEKEGEQAKIVCEVPEKRDEFSKTYKRADGSFTSVISKTPIHKLENGEWEEINNTLETNDDAINNIDGAFDVEFPETISENEQITVSNNGESIAFSVNGIENATGVVEEKEITEADIIKQDLEKSVSQITYENVDENTDIQYIVTPTYVKENIIVSNKESLKEAYSFDIEKGNLSAELDNENNLLLKNDKNEIAFTIPAPVMTDADNAFSYDIDVSVKNADKSVLTLTYTPSKQWFENAKYPVVIDPVIIFEDSNEILYEDTSIINIVDEPESRTTNYSNEAVGYIGSGASVQGNVLVKLNMNAFSFFKKPNLEVIDFIFYGLGYVRGGNVLAKAINGNWDSKTITYDDVYPLDGSEPAIAYDDKISDYITGYPLTEETNLNIPYFNITDIFKEWLYGERENDGFALVPENDSVEGVLFLTGEYTDNSRSTQFNSYCLVNYVDTSGTNDSFEYLSQEIGRAGSANVNTFSRSLSVNRSDLGLDGLRMPVNIDFIYTPAIDSFYEYLEKEASFIAGQEVTLPQVYGNHWYSSYCFYPLFAVEGQVQIFTNEGTVATFNLVEEAVTETDPETSQEITRTVKRLEPDETSDSGYELELINSNSFVMESNIKLILPSGEQVYFNDDGSTTIREEEPNSDGSYDEIRIVYLNRESLMIDYITDGIGRKYDFIYNNENRLTEIKCLTAEGTPIKAGTTDTDLKVTYGYDSNGNLTTVTYPDGETVSYTYDSNENLIKAKNIDGYNIQYTYDNLGKVTHIAEYAGTTAGNTIDLVQLSSRQVKVIDDFSGTETYQFGRDGRLHYTFDEKGNYLKSDYAPANDENVYSSNNWSISSQNLLKNGSFETASALRATRGKYWSTEFETTDLPEQQIDNKKVIGYDSKSFGEKSYFISSADDCTKFVTQTVDVSNADSYTFSAFVRSETVGELALKIKATDGSGNVQYSNTVEINSTVGWERYSVTYTPKNNFEPENITVSIGFEENKGTYYVDCVQLEKGLGTAEYNLIENGTFNNADEYWSDSTIATDLLNGEPINAVKLSGGLPQYTANADETLTLTDNISATTQNVKINGKKGETYSIGGWFKGWFDDNYIYDKVDARFADLEEQLTNSSAQLKVTYSYTDTVTTTDETTNETTTTEQLVTENFAVDFAPHNEGWQYAVDTFALKGDTECVDVTVMAKNIPADSYATGIELALDNNAFSFFETDDVTEEAPEEPGTDEEDNSNTQNTGTGNTTPPEECLCEDCEELDCACRCDSADVCTCVQCSRRSDVETTSEDGKTITTSSFDGEKYMQSAVTYSDDLNNIISETDGNNISSGYAYNVNGGLTSFTDGAGNSTTYQSNAMGYLTLAESNVSGLTDYAVKMAISYVYDGDLLTNVTEGNVQYTYEYDGWGQLKKVLVDGETLVCYNYGENEYRTRIKNIVFGSSKNTGFTVEYTYDENGNIEIVEKYRMVEGERDSITYDYAYDNLGNLDYIKDNGTGHFLDYTDDGIVIKNSQTGSIIYETKDVTPEKEEEATIEGVADNSTQIDDGTPEISSITQEIANGTSYNHKIYESAYSEETGKSTENEAVSVALSQDENNNFTYGKTIGTQTLSDWFGRNEAVTVMTKDPVDTATADFASISSQYSYVTNENITTNLISTVTNTISGEETNTVNYNYTYDSNGRIINASTVSNVANLSGASQYVYDEAGQLVKEITGSTIYEYAYDSKGNISSRKVYSGETLVSTDTFTYGAETWEDRLTGYNNKTITYDSIGNPTSYLGANLSWRGRELAGYEKGNKQISYSYDVDGMRYKKVVAEDNKTKTYDYVYSDGTLILLTYTENEVSNTARFVYDSWGEPRGFMLNDSATYLYLKNAQGDITAIVDENGEILVRYTYNAWGAVEFVVPFGVDPGVTTILATVSPFTYRGYCYDYDIGMYYLQSRYYDPQICSFINADSTDYLGAFKTDTKCLKCDKDVLYETVTGYNLFSYCENDCVNDKDYSGNKSKNKDNPKTLEQYIKREYGKKKNVLGNKRTGIEIVGNKITISANFKISGNLANKKVNKYSYEHWFIYGIQKHWKGTFSIFGYIVTLKTYATQYNKKSTDVKMEDKNIVSNTKSANRVFWSPGKNCKINMYSSDPRRDNTPKTSERKYIYSGEEFAWVSAHEFGHALGLADQGNYTKYTVMGAMNETTSSDDVETVLLSFIKRKFNGGA